MERCQEIRANVLVSISESVCSTCVWRNVWVSWGRNNEAAGWKSLVPSHPLWVIRG